MYRIIIAECEQEISSFYGEIIRTAEEFERQEKVLAAAMPIGNPFTDVPELCSQAAVVTDNDQALARQCALKLAADFWSHRHRMHARLTPLADAIAEAKTLQGPVTFTDAADAPSSGPSATAAPFWPVCSHHCRRPMFPLDPEVTLAPVAEMFGP